MADPRGFLTTARELPTRRPVDVRILDWHEVYEDFDKTRLKAQAGRCMDCGIPFCHRLSLRDLIPSSGTPDSVWRERLAEEAIERLHATNNFPEFTGRLCPAPCEASCVLGINADPRHDQAGRGRDRRPRVGRGLGRSAGAGPAHRQVGGGGRLRAGRAGRCAATHSRGPHRGGVRAGRPHRRPAALRHPGVQDGEAPSRPSRCGRWREEGTRFTSSVDVGIAIDRGRSCARFDAGVSRGGATRAATCRSPAASWTASTRRWSTSRLPTAGAGGRRSRTPIIAVGKTVVIIGGGDTGADCLGTAHRQGAASVTQLEILPRPPATSGRRRRRGRPGR